MASFDWSIAVLVTILLSDTAFSKNAFIIVDVQNCFVKDGTLEVPNGNNVVEPINKILESVKFDLVIRSQDWHCDNHVSFASQHKDKEAFSSIQLNYTSSGEICGDYDYTKTKKTCEKDEVKYRLQQTLWPDHCVIDTEDAGFVADVNFPEDVVTVKKGYHCEVDSYSAFFDNGGFTKTELDDVLKEHGITTVYSAGLATDYCVSATAKDANKLGYQSWVVIDASMHIAKPTLRKEKKQWKEQGVNIIRSKKLIRIFKRQERKRNKEAKKQGRKRGRGKGRKPDVDNKEGI